MESLENTALADKRVRQALNYAIDRETMLQSLRNNIGKPADSGVIPKGLPSYNSKASSRIQLPSHKKLRTCSNPQVFRTERVLNQSPFTRTRTISILPPMWQNSGKTSASEQISV